MMKSLALVAALLLLSVAAAADDAAPVAENSAPAESGDAGGGADGPAASEAGGDTDDEEDYDDYEYAPVTQAERTQECEEKLQIVNDLFMDNTSGNFDDEDIATIRGANGDGYPDNSLGYVWCSVFVGGIEQAQKDPGSIKMSIAPYLPVEKLPMTVNEVDELAGNDLESVALVAVTDQFDPTAFQSSVDYQDTNKSQKEATYAWSGAASLEGQAPSLGEGEIAPQKTSLTRVMMNPDKTDNKDVYMCSCGVHTSDMSAETGKGIPGDGGAGGDGDGQAGQETDDSDDVDDDGMMAGDDSDDDDEDTDDESGGDDGANDSAQGNNRKLLRVI